MKQDEKREEKVVEYVAIDDQEIISLTYKNFQKYCGDVKNAQSPDIEDEEGAQAVKPKDVKPDYDLFKKLRDVNGKTGDHIVC